jgi:hypothetical protein
MVDSLSNVQPHNVPVMHEDSKPQRKREYHRSTLKLQELKFDPISSLVRQYEELEIELNFWKDLRDGRHIPVSLDIVPVKYSHIAHMAVHEKLTRIGEALLRYGYARVPETNELDVKQSSPMIINLSKDNEQYRLNIGDVEEVDYDEE